MNIMSETINTVCDNCEEKDLKDCAECTKLKDYNEFIKKEVYIALGVIDRKD